MYDRSYTHSNTQRNHPQPSHITATTITNTPRSFAAHQVIQYNDLLIQTQRLWEDNEILQLRIQKYQLLQPYIDTLIATNAQLKAAVESLQNQNNYLGKQMRTLQVQIKEGETARHNLTANSMGTIDGLRKEIDSKASECQGLKEELVKMGQLLQIQREEVQQLNRTNYHNMEQIKQLNKDITTFQTEISKVHAYNNEISQKFYAKEKSLMQNIQEKQQKIDSLSKQINNLSIINKDLQTNLQKLRKQNQHLDSELESLQNNHELLIKDFKAITLKRVELEELLAQEKHRTGRREEQLKQVQAWRNQEKQRYKKELAERQTFMNEEFSEFKNALEHRKAKIQQLTVCSQKNIYALNAQQEANAVMKGEIQALQNSCKKLEKQKIHLETKQKDSQSKILELQNIISQYQAMVLQLKEEVNQYGKQLQNLEQNHLNKTAFYEKQIAKANHILVDQRNQWHKTSLEEKQRIIAVNNFQKKEMEETLKKKILMLEAQIDCYRAKIYTIQQRSPQRRARSMRNHPKNNIDENSDGPNLTSRQKNNITIFDQETARNNYQRSRVEVRGVSSSTGLRQNRLLGVKDKNIIFV